MDRCSIVLCKVRGRRKQAVSIFLRPPSAIPFLEKLAWTPQSAAASFVTGASVRPLPASCFVEGVVPRAGWSEGRQPFSHEVAESVVCVLLVGNPSDSYKHVRVPENKPSS